MIDKANDEQNKLPQKIREFKCKVYNGFESEIFPLPNQSMVLAKREQSSSSEISSSPDKLSSLEHSSDSYEYISPEEKISENDLNYSLLK